MQAISLTSVLLLLVAVTLGRPHHDHMFGLPPHRRHFGPPRGHFHRKPIVVAPIILSDDEDEEAIMPASTASSSWMSMLNPYMMQAAMAQQQPCQQTPSTFGQARSGLPLGQQAFPTLPQQQQFPTAVQTLPQVQTQAPVQPVAQQPRSQLVTSGTVTSTTPQQPAATTNPTAELTKLVIELQNDQKKRQRELEEQHHLEKLALIQQTSEQVMARALEQAQRNQQLLDSLSSQPQTQPQTNFDVLQPDARMTLPTGTPTTQTQPLVMQTAPQTPGVNSLVQLWAMNQNVAKQKKQKSKKSKAKSIMSQLDKYLSYDYY